MPIWHQSPKLTPRYFLETSRLFGYPINWLFNFFVYYEILFFQVSECILASHHYPIYQKKITSSIFPSLIILSASESRSLTFSIVSCERYFGKYFIFSFHLCTAPLLLSSNVNELSIQ